MSGRSKSRSGRQTIALPLWAVLLLLALAAVYVFFIAPRLHPEPAQTSFSLADVPEYGGEP